MAERFTLIDDDRVVETRAVLTNEAVMLAPDELRSALGWEIGPEGLCQGAQCIPVRDQALVTAQGVDLVRLAALLDRPLALEPAERAAVLGVSASTRGAQLASGVAPDFSLPDWNGKMHALSEFRGQKVFLLAWASW